jgi:hypothetical protein
VKKGIVVDANVMNSFVKALKDDAVCPQREIVNLIDRSVGFALDAGQKMERQWLDTCGSSRSSLFFEWYYARLNKSIRYVECVRDDSLRKRLFIECGFPRRKFEIVYVEVAAATNERYIVTNDIDFWNPKLKTAEAKTKEACKRERTGCVYKLLRRAGMTVGTTEQALAELGS